MFRARDEFKQELHCEMCGGAMKILAPIHPPDTTKEFWSVSDCRLDLHRHQEDSFHPLGPRIIAWVRFRRHGRRHFSFNILDGFLKRFGTQAVCAGFIRFKHGGLPVEGRNKVRGHTSAKAVSLAVTIRQFRGVSFRRAGAIGGGRQGRPRESRILRATDGSSIAARSIPNDLSNRNCLPTQADGTSRSDFE
jgi:hypothetical protein